MNFPKTAQIDPDDKTWERARERLKKWFFFFFSQKDSSIIIAENLRQFVLLFHTSKREPRCDCRGGLGGRRGLGWPRGEGGSYRRPRGGPELSSSPSLFLTPPSVFLFSSIFSLVLNADFLFKWKARVRESISISFWGQFETALKTTTKLRKNINPKPNQTALGQLETVDVGHRAGESSGGRGYQRVLRPLCWFILKRY